MYRVSRLFWALLLVLSVAWIGLGSFLTSEHFDNGNLGNELSSEIQSLGSDIQVDALGSLALPALFLATGLPLALIALFFLWRNIRRSGASIHLDSETIIRRQALLVSTLALVFAVFLWNLRGANTDSLTISTLIYHLRLLVTFIHEVGHSLAALVTGGHVDSFSVLPDGSGYAKTAGGYRALIIPAGYLGAALFGSTLFLVSSRAPQWTRGLAIVIGLSITMLTLSYAMPDPTRNATALLIGISFGALLMVLGWLAPTIVNLFVINTLAILIGLNAVFDVTRLIGNADAGRGDVLNDAARFSEEITPLLPASVIAIIWSAISIFMLGAAVYFGLIKPARVEIGDAVRGREPSSA